MSHVVRLGDCLDPVAGMASLPDKSVDHCITDPPYEAEAHTLQRRTGNGDRGLGSREKPLDFGSIDEDTRRSAAAHMARVSRRRSAMAWYFGSRREQFTLPLATGPEPKQAPMVLAPGSAGVGGDGEG